jgi:hypothetical protein
MRTKSTVAALALCAAAFLPGATSAQTQGSAPPAVRTDEAPTAGTPQPGSNSFTEGQARSRMEDAGFRDVSDLQKDDQGIWRGRATRNGQQTEVALDFHGNVFGGGTAAGPAAPGGMTGAVARDGAPGNPPSTAAGRAVDRAQGQTPRPDGAPGNPPGTAAGRATDRALGTNATGAHPGAGSPSR